MTALVNKKLLAVCPSVGSGRLTIAYSIKQGTQHAGMKIFDASGRLVKSFSLPTSNFLLPTSVEWNGTDDAGRQVPTGVYFVRLEADGQIATDKAILLH